MPKAVPPILIAYKLVLATKRRQVGPVAGVRCPATSAHALQVQHCTNLDTAAASACTHSLPMKREP